MFVVSLSVMVSLWTDARPGRYQKEQENRATNNKNKNEKVARNPASCSGACCLCISNTSLATTRLSKYQKNVKGTVLHLSSIDPHEVEEIKCIHRPNITQKRGVRRWRKSVCERERERERKKERQKEREREDENKR